MVERGRPHLQARGASGPSSDKSPWSKVRAKEEIALAEDAVGAGSGNVTMSLSTLAFFVMCF